MKKRIIVLLTLMIVILTATTLSAYAGDSMIEVIENVEDEIKNEEYVIINVSVADDVGLPLTVLMESGLGTISMKIEKNGDTFKVIPTTYTIKRAVSKSGKEYEPGATLTISKDGGDVYLDFNKPVNKVSGLPLWGKVLISNIVFLIIAFIAYKIFSWYRNHLA